LSFERFILEFCGGDKDPALNQLLFSVQSDLSGSCEGFG